jgi:quercetin dioxygenase-like cupin family protein
MMKRVVTVLGVVVACLLAGPAPADEAKKAEGSKKPAAKAAYVITSMSELKWVDSPVKGAKLAVLRGDPEKGAYAAIHRWPGGTDVGWHTHTSPIELVVVSGTMIITPDGKDPKELGSGDWAWDPGRFKHRSQCKAGADCVFFVTQRAKFDFLPVEEKK